MTALNWIDWTVILAYSAIVAALGFSFARGHKSTDEYFKLSCPRQKTLP